MRPGAGIRAPGLVRAGHRAVEREVAAEPEQLRGDVGVSLEEKRIAGDPGTVEYEVILPWIGAATAVAYRTQDAEPEFWPTDLSAEAIRLMRVLVSLMPDEPEVQGLLALMLLSDARREARTRDGEIMAHR